MLGTVSKGMSLGISTSFGSPDWNRLRTTRGRGSAQVLTQRVCGAAEPCTSSERPGEAGAAGRRTSSGRQGGRGASARPRLGGGARARRPGSQAGRRARALLRSARSGPVGRPPGPPPRRGHTGPALSGGGGVPSRQHLHHVFDLTPRGLSLPSSGLKRTPRGTKPTFLQPPCGPRREPKPSPRGQGRCRPCSLLQHRLPRVPSTSRIALLSLCQGTSSPRPPPLRKAPHAPRSASVSNHDTPRGPCAVSPSPAEFRASAASEGSCLRGPRGPCRLPPSAPGLETEAAPSPPPTPPCRPLLPPGAPRRSQAEPRSAPGPGGCLAQHNGHSPETSRETPPEPSRETRRDPPARPDMIPPRDPTRFVPFRLAFAGVDVRRERCRPSRVFVPLLPQAAAERVRPCRTSRPASGRSAGASVPVAFRRPVQGRPAQPELRERL
ncbi:proline-rich protein 36-like [Diceros bicornis minor]|uniref:proline-rich protein 36-like n=1 Tax=Diceros bicornis minor TaxID=77932 RepID=UPI0026EE1811|nr:proline-rich protein 36-like [Diceros bicornis minor]